MVYQSSIAPSFGNNSFANIINSVDIKVWHITHQYVGPIVIGKCYLFTRNKLKATVRSKVDESIGFKSIACPQIGGYVWICGRSLYAMGNGFNVFTGTGHRLRQNGHITKLEACHCQIRLSILFIPHIFTRGFSVLRAHCLY